MANNFFDRDWWKQFLTAVLGTAIGVGLSFGVSNLVDNHKKALAQRQTATMAVYDIDEIIRALKENLKTEESLFSVAYSLSNLQDRLENVSADSLRKAVTYLLENKSDIPAWATDTKEKAFTSSIDAWKNLENTRFYDNVQRCYLSRGELLRVVSNDAVFRRPVSEETTNAFIAKCSGDDLAYDGSLNENALCKLLKQAYSTPETTRFLRMYQLRSRVYNQYIDELSRLNRENKFLMDLSDKELNAYIRKNVQKTKAATEKLVAGSWEAQLNEVRQILSLHPDHTADITVELFDMGHIHLDAENRDIQVKVPVSYRMSGDWTLTADTLLLNCPTGRSEILSIDLDLDKLPEGAREKGQKWLDEYRSLLEGELKSSGINQKNAVSLDLTGNIMLWSFEYTNSLGQKENIRQQLVRIQE